MIEALRFNGHTLSLLDQRQLPHHEVWNTYTSAESVAAAIRDMVVRGAPAIGLAAAYGMALEAARGGDLVQAHQVLLQSRPTAVHLRWALDQLAAIPPETWGTAAVAVHREDAALHRVMGDIGANLLAKLPRRPLQLLTHCNTGALATGGWGTALGVVRSLHALGVPVHVWVDETRPWLQGARLTAWELFREQIPCTLLADGAAASLFAAGKVDAVVVGADRIAKNGDTANKTGTLSVAVIAAAYRVPFYVVAPVATFDAACPDGSHIPIEHRPAAEVRGWRDQMWAPDVPAYNPAFDVTPFSLIAGWITEAGVLQPPFGGKR